MIKKVLYGCGNLSYSVISQTLSNFFMFYATSVLGISGTLVGIAIAISTIWDGISDTLFGYFSDNYNFLKIGKRNGYMLVATIGMSIVNIAIWCVPNTLALGLKFVWIIISLLILETFNTMFSTPYIALGNELAKNDEDRTKINATSTVFYLIGIIIPSVLLYVFLPSTDLYPIGQLNPKGYVKIAITSSVICLIFGLISTLSTIRKNNKLGSENKLNFRDLFANFVSAFKDYNLRKVILGYVFTCMATVFLCSVGLHFFTYSFFYSSSQITIILLSLIVGNIISQPLWVKLSKKYSKSKALVWAILLTILSVFVVIGIFIFRIELVNISFYLMVVVLLICGIGSGGLYSLPTSIYGDLVMKMENGDNLIGVYSGVITFASNIANSLTQLMVGILLDVINFDSSVELQTLQVQTGLALILFIGIQVSLILGCFIFSKFVKNN